MNIDYHVPQQVLEFHGKGNSDVLLLHGYQQTAEVLWRQLQPLSSLFRRILLPNGPYPVPFQHTGSWRIGYSWYFFDRTQNKYFVEMDVAARDVASFAQAELSEGAMVIGFSQGGYLAPFVAEQAPRIARVIGLNCRMRDEAWNIQRRFRIDQIHSRDDRMVDIERSRICFAEIQKAGHPGEFYETEGGHFIGPPLIETLKTLIESP